ncbi:helix-turn-helix domain-containing protein [Actinomadura alba]|uniref:Helix-turn-helix transcriptional regulator n=1 Tax=Actinomadura alba TaxID=406431 RepID=A0ABR7LQ09_9ACTN|nr:helix-turn-helix transcriptional regulator [Actinomadura alba]MBC6466664.1 helix-turn-helix transcriptional regulator [Actinomadura alba]
MPADDKARLGARLRKERKDRGLVVEDLAEEFRKVAPERIRQRLPKLKDLQRMIRGWEAGEHKPGEQYRLLYSRAFRMDEEELFGHDGQSFDDWEVPSGPYGGCFREMPPVHDEQDEVERHAWMLSEVYQVTPPAAQPAFWCQTSRWGTKPLGRQAPGADSG